MLSDNEKQVEPRKPLTWLQSRVLMSAGAWGVAIFVGLIASAINTELFVFWVLAGLAVTCGGFGICVMIAILDNSHKWGLK